MNNQQLNHLIQMLTRGGGRSRSFALMLVVVLIGYTLLQPVIEKRFGVSLPGLVGGQAETPARPADGQDDHRDSSRGQLGTHPQPRVATTISNGERAILEAFAARQSDMIVEVDAVVQKNLPDDDVGSRHQKMILQLPSGHTILLAHNIDLAQRVPAKQGDRVRVKGEYEFSEPGGVLHWTHHDPAGRHVGGWIEHDGRRYE